MCALVGLSVCLCILASSQDFWTVQLLREAFEAVAGRLWATCGAVLAGVRALMLLSKRLILLLLLLFECES